MAVKAFMLHNSILEQFLDESLYKTQSYLYLSLTWHIMNGYLNGTMTL
jgi:hypothetical protein